MDQDYNILLNVNDILFIQWLPKINTGRGLKKKRNSRYKKDTYAVYQFELHTCDINDEF